MAAPTRSVWVQFALKSCLKLNPYIGQTCVSRHSTFSRKKLLTISSRSSQIPLSVCCQIDSVTNDCVNPGHARKYQDRPNTLCRCEFRVKVQHCSRCYLHSHAVLKSNFRSEGEWHKVNGIRNTRSRKWVEQQKHNQTVIRKRTEPDEISEDDFYGIGIPSDKECFEEENISDNIHIEKKTQALDTEPDLGSNDVHVHVKGDATRAILTYRQRAEKRALRDNADPTSAATVAGRIRRELKEKAKQAGKGEEDETVKPKSRDMKHQIRELWKLQPVTVASILTKCVIYNQGDIVAIDKPYGLPSHGGPGVTHSIAHLLPLLAKNLAKKGEDDLTLHLVHRLDKETTGVMVLAKTEEVLRRLQAMFRQRKVIKKYWVITSGVPDPPTGVIDMPMAEVEIGNRYRMVVKPDLSSLQLDGVPKRRRTSATDAITKFKVLDSSKKSALVELEAMTGVKHQIRVHLAQGMACPILGDHKYSHFTKQAPQRLPYSTLLRLGISQQKVRTVPMHLHAQMLVLPEFLDGGRNLRISTKLPKFFAANMKKLKLRVP